MDSLKACVTFHFDTQEFLQTFYLMVAVADFKSCIYKGLGFAWVHLAFCVFNASETGLLLMVKLRRNVGMMCTGCKIMHQVMHDVKLLNKKI